MPKSTIDNWTHCITCWDRQDHEWDPESRTWRCSVCKVTNWDLTRTRRVLSEVAEQYLEENPEE